MKLDISSLPDMPHFVSLGQGNEQSRALEYNGTIATVILFAPEVVVAVIAVIFASQQN